MTTAVFDVGGTFLRAGIYRRGRLARAFFKRATPTKLTLPGMPPPELQRRLLETLDDLRDLVAAEAEPERFGVAIAGPVSGEGVVQRAPSLWGAYDRPLALRQILKRRWRMDGVVVNDVTAAAAHFASQGRYDRFRRIAVLTVSTGIGLKVWDRVLGECLLGPKGFGGEVGHWPWPTENACSCGRLNHMNGAASGRSMEYMARRLALERPAVFRRSFLHRLVEGDAARIDVSGLAVLAKQPDDAFYGEYLERISAPVAQAVGALAVSLGLEKFVLMGGVVGTFGAGYKRALLRHLRRQGVYGRSSAAIDDLLDLAPPGLEPGLLGVGRIAPTWLSGRKPRR